MKTIFTLLLSTVFSLASMAFDGTRLTVTSVSNNKMFVEVDGRRYNLDGNTVSISSIRPWYAYRKSVAGNEKKSRLEPG
jgi:hypothetical protein